MVESKPTVISTFCGTGGSSLGYKWAGFKELLAIDYESHAVECFRANFPEVPCWQKSVVDITGEEILNFCKIKKGDLDIFDGSPPCQGFSISGKREVSDKRNDLFKEFARLVEGLSPRVFVMENVVGMIKGKMKGRFIEIMNKLKSLGYNVKCKKMNSKYFGVPQSRERLIFIGVRADLNKVPVFPIPNSKIISAYEAIKDIKPTEIKKVEVDFVKSILTKIRPGELASKYHPTGSYFNYSRSYKYEPCRTLTKKNNVIHYDEDRYLSVDEYKVLSSFPIDWILGDKPTKAFKRIGNAVMPKFMQAIAETIKDEILN